MLTGLERRMVTGPHNKLRCDIINKLLHNKQFILVPALGFDHHRALLGTIQQLLFSSMGHIIIEVIENLFLKRCNDTKITVRDIGREIYRVVNDDFKFNSKFLPRIYWKVDKLFHTYLSDRVVDLSLSEQYDSDTETETGTNTNPWCHWISYPESDITSSDSFMYIISFYLGSFMFLHFLVFG